MASRILGPVTEREDHFVAYCDQIDDLNMLRERAKALLRTYPQTPSFKTATELAERAAPPRPQAILDMLKQLRTVVAASAINRLRKEIDFRSVQTTCEAILKAVEELRHVAPLQAGWPAPAGGTDFLISDEEIHSLREQVEKIEEEQRGIDRREQEQFEEKQRKATSEAHRQQEHGVAHAPTQQNAATTLSAGRGQRKDKHTEFILNEWDSGNHNAESIKRKLLAQLPPLKRRNEANDDQLFKRVWRNACKHCPEMRPESRRVK
jgi:hypothetical protein